jgi:hypothetical protein
MAGRMTLPVYGLPADEFPRAAGPCGRQGGEQAARSRVSQLVRAVAVLTLGLGLAVAWALVAHNILNLFFLR